MSIGSGPLSLAEALLSLGLLFFLGLLADLVGRHSFIPRVTLVLLAGVAIGRGGIDLVPAEVTDLFPALTTIALTMIGFLLGGRLRVSSMRRLGPAVLGMSLGIALVTSAVVTAGLTIAGEPWPVALVLGGIAVATDPAATVDVIRELKAKNRFTRMLTGIVAVDDLWGVLIFSVLLASAVAVAGTVDPWAAIRHGFREIGLAAGVGIALGIPLALATGRVESGEPTQSEALGGVLVCAGLSIALEVSYIVSSIFLGLTVARFAHHHKRPFHAIEGIEWPFLLLFFFLAGASLDPADLVAVGWAGGLFMLLRILGRLLGAAAGGRALGLPAGEARSLGAALLPQAGVSIGLALLAIQSLPAHADVILPIVLASTVFFELVGPVITKSVLRRQGRISAGRRASASGRNPGS